MSESKIILVQEEPRGPSQLIEIPVTKAVSRVNFPDVQQLRSMADQIIITKSMRLITLNLLALGPITGLANAPLAELQNASLVIYCEGWEKAQLLPILVLNDTTIPGGTFPHRYHETKFDNWRNIDWSKSYIQYSNGFTATPPYVIMIDVTYVKLDAQGNEIKGAS